MTSQNKNHRPPAGSFAELWRVALPLVLSSGSVTLMYFVDRVFLTWYSTDALAAAMPAGVLHWTVLSLLFGTVMYANTFVAQYDGAERPDRAASSVWQGMYLALFGGCGFALLVPFTEVLFAWVGHEPSVQRLEAEYFRVICGGTVVFAMAAALSCFYSGRGLTRVVMVVNFFMAAINIMLDYLLIFGRGGFPELGMRGAAWATVIAHLLAVIMYLGLLSRRQEREEYGFWTHWRFESELFGRMLRYGLPTGLQHFAEVAGFSVFLFLVGLIGTQELAATNLAFNLNSLAFVPMMGIGTAVMTLVGRRIGEGRPELAVRTAWMAFWAAGSFMLAFAAVYLFVPDVILYPFAVYTPPAEFDQLRREAIGLLQFVALYSFFDAMAIVFSSAVRGAGDTRFPMVFTLLSAWLVMVLPPFVAWKLFGGSLSVSWWSCTGYIMLIGVGFLIRFQMGKWKSMRVIDDVIVAEPVRHERPATADLPRTAESRVSAADRTESAAEPAAGGTASAVDACQSPASAAMPAESPREA